MRLLIITHGSFNHPSSRIRALQYIPYFKKSGFNQIKWIPRAFEVPKNLIGKRILFPITKIILSFKIITYLIFWKSDMIYIQRFFVKNWLIKIVKKRGIPIIYDFDDAVYIDKDNESKNSKLTASMVINATKVVVSTKELVPFCNKYNVSPTIITTPVELQKKLKKRSEKNFTIGWIGSPTNGVHLHEIQSVIEQTNLEKNVNWLIVGYRKFFEPNSNSVIFKKWSLSDEETFLLQMDIGIMPLIDWEVTRAKGGYKLLLYMSYGIPVIASPIGINKEIVQEGENGFFATTNEEWISKIYQLQEDENLWKSMSEKAFQTIEKKYSREICYKKLDICIQQALKMHPKK